MIKSPFLTVDLGSGLPFCKWAFLSPKTLGSGSSSTVPVWAFPPFGVSLPTLFFLEINFLPCLSERAFGFSTDSFTSVSSSESLFSNSSSKSSSE